MFAKRSSVVNLIYSGQQQFSYTGVYKFQCLYIYNNNIKVDGKRFLFEIIKLFNEIIIWLKIQSTKWQNIGLALSPKDSLSNLKVYWKGAIVFQQSF